VTAAVRRTAIKETKCTVDEVSVNWRFGNVKNAEGKLTASSKEISKLANTLFEPLLTPKFRPVFPIHFFLRSIF